MLFVLEIKKTLSEDNIGHNNAYTYSFGKCTKQTF